MAVLESGRVNYWTGDEGKSFEKEFALYCGVQHGVALANGTLALDAALRALNIGAGDEVVVTPRSFVASVSCVALLGGVPVFADVDPESQCMTADSIEAVISDRTKAILVVHLAGWPCDMTSIKALADRRDICLIEDCAQAHGARWENRPVGSFGDIGVFSFCQDKIITTAGEGGMLITNDSELHEKVWSFKDHGKRIPSANPVPKGSGTAPGFRWLHESLGSNYRLTELQAAVGRLQLQKLDHWVETRRRNADRLSEGLQDLPALRIPRPAENAYHAYYKFYAFVRTGRLKPDWSRDRILQALQAEGIPGLSGACPEIYREKAFEYLNQEPLQNAARLGRTSLMFMVHPTLGTDDIDDMARGVRKVMAAATGS